MKLISSTVIALAALVFGTYVHAESYCKDAPKECAYGQPLWRPCNVNYCKGNCAGTGRTRPHCCANDKSQGDGDYYCVFP
ncbi:hypothetical protein E6O75_ATG11393 [Venturia nashicola]|uniref:Uncharacterized protein n=1 Tax=Venturia nashicola TaxID=86259 RepID=A0A4Z1NI73_9PEZI|nr:hypothetical protein E6O75_ATG11393 [Venturia nashicola]